MNHFLIHPFRQIFFLLFPFLLFLPSCLQAADFFEQGNQAYMRNDYAAAITCYRQAAEKRGFSASLLYNLGNSYARSGKTGPAVLAYEQALRLAPTNSDIRANLESVRKASGLYQPNQPWWLRTISILGADQWLLLAGISFSLFSGSLLLMALVRKSWSMRILKSSAVITLACALSALPPALFSYRHRHDDVVLTSTRLKISPFAEAASAGAIQEGRIVTPLKIHKAFVFVQDTNGRKGWIPARELGSIQQLTAGQAASASPGG